METEIERDIGKTVIIRTTAVIAIVIAIVIVIVIAIVIAIVIVIVIVETTHNEPTGVIRTRTAIEGRRKDTTETAATTTEARGKRSGKPMRPEEIWASTTIVVVGIAPRMQATTIVVTGGRMATMAITITIMTGMD